jgi:hypothetical protein
MTRFYGVLSDGIDDVWPDFFPYLQATLQRGNERHDAASIWKALHEKDMQLWLAYDDSGCRGFCITQVINYPCEKSCQIIFGGGIFDKNWRGFLDHIEDWARFNGCHSIEILGRIGWNKVFKSSGYDFRYAVVAKKL